MDIWKTSTGRNNEQSIEAFHKISSEGQEQYESQRGDLKERYFINHLMLITSPLYQ